MIVHDCRNNLVRIYRQKRNISRAAETPHDRLFVFKPDELKSLNMVTAGAAGAPVAGPSSPPAPMKARFVVSQTCPQSSRPALGRRNHRVSTALFAHIG